MTGQLVPAAPQEYGAGERHGDQSSSGNSEADGEAKVVDEIAHHRRCYLRNQQILEPMHYLAVLGRRPAALDHSDVFRNWQLPACFTELREVLENRHGPFAGARQDSRSANWLFPVHFHLFDRF